MVNALAVHRKRKCRLIFLGAPYTLAVVLIFTLLVAPFANPSTLAASRGYAPSMVSRIRLFALSGHQPDLDPIYRLVITATLHDSRAKGIALPDQQLVMSTYMEVFQPTTTPVLPDILNPGQLASGLRSFLTGKCALVNPGGLIAYRGSLLGEILAANQVHLVLDLVRPGPHPGATVRLQGRFALVPGTEYGILLWSGPLDRAALTVPSRPSPSWQAIVSQLAVAAPVMVGAPASAGPQPSPTAPPRH